MAKYLYRAFPRSGLSGPGTESVIWGTSIAWPRDEYTIIRDGLLCAISCRITNWLNSPEMFLFFFTQTTRRLGNLRDVCLTVSNGSGLKPDIGAIDKRHTAPSSGYQLGRGGRDL